MRCNYCNRLLVNIFFNLIDINRIVNIIDITKNRD